MWIYFFNGFKKMGINFDIGEESCTFSDFDDNSLRNDSFAASKSNKYTDQQRMVFRWTLTGSEIPKTFRRKKY